jgi:hypothetical protein
LVQIEVAWRLMLAAVLLSPAAFAQSSAGGGSIQGFVRDSSGLAIPAAKITITSEATNSATRLESNAEGFFLTPPVSIGKYRMRIEAPGMKIWESEATVETGRLIEVTATLQPGQVTEIVQVTETVPLVTTTEATEAATLDSRRIREIPVNGRNLNVLLETVVPGVEALQDVNGGIRASGLMSYSTDYVQDGANANNREFGGSAGLQGLESIGEVRVETSASSARYSRPTSVIVSTKSGTNRMLFSLYETHRNNAFGVARARQDVNLDGTPFRTPKLIRNEFGGTIGGPIVIPSMGLNGRKLLYDGRNRSWFFYSREGTEFVQGLTRTFRVPTAAMRQGDFSGLFDSTGRRLQLYDPLSTRIEEINGRLVSVRDPFSNNQIPVERRSMFAQRIYDITPLPTDVTNPLVADNLKIVVPTSALPNLSDNPQVLRLDHHFSANDKVFLKLNSNTRTAHFLGTGSATGAPTRNNEANVTYLPVSARSIGISWTHMFNSTFFVETLVNRTWQLTRTVTGPVDKDWSAELGLPNPLGEVGWPELTSTGFMSYVEGDNRRSLYSMVSNAEQNYKLVRSSHSFGWGWRWHAEKQNLLPDQGAISGAAAFNSNATALESPTLGTTLAPQLVPQTGFDGANFFLGYAGQYRVGLKRGIMRVRDRNWGLYVDDSWRISQRLTLFPGVRWDINPAFYEKDGQLSAFDLRSRSIVLPESLEHYYKLGATTPQLVRAFQTVGVSIKSAEELGRSKQLFPSNLFDIGPRFGLAYSLQNGSRPWVVRAGYGLYISAVPMRTLLAQFSGLAPFRATFTYNPNAANQSPDGIVNYLARTVPTVEAGANSRDLIDLDDPGALGRGTPVIGMDGKQPSLKIHEWNLGLEKQIAASTVIRLSYRGKHGSNSDQLYNINAQAPDYIWYLTTGRAIPGGEFSGVLRRPYDQNAYTDVRILQRSGIINTTLWTAEIERRFRNGLNFQFFYTLTNALRLAGNSFRDDVVPSPANFLPGTVPTDFKELNRFLFYDRDTGVPKHRVRWNFGYDLPFGRRGHFFKRAGGALNNLIGGWRLSGTGTVVSSWYSMPTGNWGEMSEFQVYGKQHKVLDCQQTPVTSTNFRDERCVEGYLWYNGYISERLIDARNPSGLRIGIFGLPPDYKPAQKPINPWPKNGQPTDLNNADYDTNVVYLPLVTGGVVRVNYDTGLHPWRNQSKLGPFNWTMDSSLLKTFRITESRVSLRLNVDVFNVFNVQGLNVPGASGIASLQNSYGGFGIRPRQLQLGLRLGF